MQLEQELPQLHQIGTVAERVGLSLRTIRHYEDVGLVVPSGRSGGGFRLYTDVDIARLTQVKVMKPLGFTLEETSRVLELRQRVRDDSATPAEADELRGLAERGAARCREQRARLDDAQTFSDALCDETNRHQAGTTASTVPNAPTEDPTWR